MRARKLTQDDVADVARRRLELLSAELAALRPQLQTGDGQPDEADPWDLSASEGLSRPAPWDEPVLPGTVLPDEPVPRGRHARRSLGVADRVAGWFQDRLPPTLQGRTGTSPAHLLVVGLVVVVGLALTAWWTTRALGGSSAAPATRPAAATSPLVAVPAASAAEAGTSPGAATTTPPVAPVAAPTSPGGAGSVAAPPSGEIVVDVAGKVRRPGIATLPAGSRVADALEAAGGARTGASLGSLNLARVLADGEQVLVGVPAAPGTAASAASAAGAGTGSATGIPPVVNLNTATQDQLEQLPGVGPVTARSILDFRAEKGRFSSVDELLEVSGIGDATLAKIAPYVSL